MKVATARVVAHTSTTLHVQDEQDASLCDSVDDLPELLTAPVCSACRPKDRGPSVLHGIQDTDALGHGQRVCRRSATCSCCQVRSSSPHAVWPPALSPPLTRCTPQRVPAPMHAACRWPPTFSPLLTPCTPRCGRLHSMQQELARWYMQGRCAPLTSAQSRADSPVTLHTAHSTAAGDVKRLGSDCRGGH